MNKKAQSKVPTGVWVILSIVLIVAVGGFGFMAYQSQKQTALEEQRQKAELAKPTETASIESNVGKVAVLKASATDKENNNPNTQVAVPARFWKANKDGIWETFASGGAQYKKYTGSFKEWIGSSATVALSSTTTTSISPVNVGDIVCGSAFNGTGTSVSFIGETSCVELATEAESLKLPTHTGCTATQLQGVIYSTGSTTGQNISVGVNGDNSFDKVYLRVNSTDCAYNLGGFYVDTTSGTNVDDINLGSETKPLTKSNKAIKRIKEKDDYVFELDAPLLMHENEKFYTGSLSVSADGDGCSPAERLNVSAYDSAQYLPIAGLALASGAEDDQSSPADVGSPDIPIISSGKGASTTNSVNEDGTVSFFCIP